MSGHTACKVKYMTSLLPCILFGTAVFYSYAILINAKTKSERQLKELVIHTAIPKQEKLYKSNVLYAEIA